MLQSTSQAIEIARKRRVLPTALGSRDIRGAFTKAARARATFSARWHHQASLQILHTSIRQALAGKDASGKPFGRAEFIARMQFCLDAYGYDPLKGFGLPADAAIPPGFPGGITDLSSRKRLELIYDTQVSLLENAARVMRETEPERVRMFPAWQLVRIGDRDVPRGKKRDRDGNLIDVPEEKWDRRWIESGGPAETGMIALKWDKVWSRLGDSSRYNDGLDTKHPPYAFNSGMGLREVTLARAVKVLGKFKFPKLYAPKPELPSATFTVPEAFSRKALEKILSEDAKERGGKLTLDDILERELKRGKEAGN